MGGDLNQRNGFSEPPSFPSFALRRPRDPQRLCVAPQPLILCVHCAALGDAVFTAKVWVGRDKFLWDQSA